MYDNVRQYLNKLSEKNYQLKMLKGYLFYMMLIEQY